MNAGQAWVGVHPNLPNDSYHQGPGISKSHLDVMNVGPRAYWHAYVNPNRGEREEKSAWKLGSATHCAILEPHKFWHEFAVEPDDAPRRPNSRQINAKKPSSESLDAIAYWGEFDKTNEGKTILTAEQFNTAWTMGETVKGHPRAGKLLAGLQSQGGSAEVSYFAIDPETGALVKCRFDFHAPPTMLDVKTTRNASPGEFARHVAEYRYGVQEAWYRKVHKLVTGEDFGEWYFLAVDSAAPHQIGLYTLPRDYVAACGRVADQNLRQIVEARASGQWPDYAYAGPRELVMPRWAQSAVGMNSAQSDYDGLDND